MDEAERLAAIWEAADAIGDDGLLLATLFAMRRQEFRAAMKALLRAGPATQEALGFLLPAEGQGSAANLP